MTELFLIITIIFAVLAIETNVLRRAVIYLGVFSLASSFCYLLYKAPDVAIAEAVIGSTLGTILYLIALKKYRVFTVYNTQANETDDYSNREKNNILKLIEEFCVSRELEPEVVNTTHTPEEIEADHQYDMIIRCQDDCIFICGNEKSYQMSSLKEYIESRRSLKSIPIIYENRKGDWN